MAQRPAADRPATPDRSGPGPGGEGGAVATAAEVVLRPGWLVAAVLLVVGATLGALNQGYTPHPLRSAAERSLWDWVRHPVEVNPAARLAVVPNRLQSIAVQSIAAGGGSVDGAAAASAEAGAATAAAATTAPPATAPAQATRAARSGEPEVRLWAVGNAGAVVVSGNRGATWTARDSKVQENLTSVHVPGGGPDGWAVGDGGAILHSGDGGATWQVQRSGTGLDLWAVHFVDARRGWAVGEDGLILVTTDGGGRWLPQPGPNDDLLSSVQVLADGRTGWIAAGGGRALHTTDAGQTWRSVAVLPEAEHTALQALQFAADGQRGWAVGNGETVARTTDGGRSWQRAWPPGRSATGTDSASGALHTLRALHVHTDALRVWAVGDDGAVLATQDGGVTWQRQDSGVAAGLLSIGFMPDGRRGWALGDGGTMIATLDGGQTWVTQASGDQASLAATAFTPDGQRGWAVGPKGLLLATDDGGRVWSAQRSGVGTDLSALHVHAGGQLAWAVGDGGTLIATRDAGRHWALQELPEAAAADELPPDLQSVQFLADGQRGWVVGGRGQVAATGDGGRSWTWQALPPVLATNGDDPTRPVTASADRTRLWGLHFLPGGERGWIVGSQQSVYLTHDEGRTWRRTHRADDDTRLHALQVLDDGRRGWAVGDAGTVLRTDDGGETWQAGAPADAADPAGSGGGYDVGNVASNAATAPTDAAVRSARLRAVRFSADGRRGLLVGERGAVWRTDDAGQSWQTRRLETGSTRRSVWLDAAGERGWSVGDPPALNRIEQAGEVWVLEDWPLRHRAYPAPWYWLALLGAAAMVWQAFRGSPPAQAYGAEAMATSDAPARQFDQDRLAFGPIARGMSRFLRNAATEPPLTLAVTGDWGVGKSSLMHLLCTDLRRYGYRPVWFNAWHHQGDEQLLAGLLAAVQRQGLPGWWTLEGWAFRLALLWQRSRQNFAWAFAMLVLLSGTLAWLWQHGATDLTRLQGLFGDLPKQLEEALKSGNTNGLTGTLGSLLPGGVLLPVGYSIYRALRAFGVDPAVLLAGTARHLSVKDASAATNFRGRFAEQFQQVTRCLPYRLVIVIDDLDRCRPDAVLSVMESVNFLVSSGPCLVVFGMATPHVEAALAMSFEKVVKELAAIDLAALADPDHPAPTEAEQRHRYVRQYLEKLINVEVRVPSRDDVPPHRLLQAASARQRQVARWRASAWGLGPALLLAGAVLLGVYVGQAVELPTAPPPQGSRSDLTGATPGRAAPAAGRAVPAARPADVALPLQRVGSGHADGLGGGAFVFGLTLLAALSLAYATYRLRAARQVVHDSPAFEQALRAWLPVVQRRRATPRAIKRFGNRVRYLAMLQQAESLDTAARDALWARLPAQLPARWRQWLSGVLGPAASIDPAAAAAAMAEHRIVALGALHDVHGDRWREHLQPAPPDPGADGTGQVATGQIGTGQQGAPAPSAAPDTLAVQRAIDAYVRTVGASWPPSEAELDAFARTLQGIRLAGDPLPG